MAPVFDVYATTYPSAIKKAKLDGYSNFNLSQWAANSSNMLRPISSEECNYDISFIGSKYGNREKWIKGLKKNGIKVECFGYGWPNGPVTSEQIPIIINQSKISLNFGDSGFIISNTKIERNRQIKARVFEVPGAGGLLMSEPAEHLEDFYTLGEEIVIFEGINELVYKVNYLLANPRVRDEIAKSAYVRTIQEHSYEQRFEILIDTAVKNRAHRKDVNEDVNMDQFEDLAQAHKVGHSLKLIKLIVLFPCILIWGKRRGSRAARRLIFEISWRIFGRKTYSVVGLPGRMFYKSS